MNLITKKIVKILSKRKPLKIKNELLNQYNYLENGHIDSLNFIKFVFEIENTFNISFHKREINSSKFKVISGLVNIINSKIKKNKK